MKTHFKKPLFALALVAGLGLLLAGRVTAQTFTTLHSFSTGGYYSFGVYIPNSDGSHPVAGLTLSGNALYGTASGGGSSGGYSSGDGTVFKVNTDGTGFTNLHSFVFIPDGDQPQAGLILSSNRLYGTAFKGGNALYLGTVFAVNSDGTGFTNLHTFYGNYNGNDGARPNASLIMSGNILYGTTQGGGSSLAGTVFAVNIDGTGFTNLYSFTASSNNSLGAPTNSDGVSPHAGLFISGNSLYGTALRGGSSGSGTVFAINSDGTGFKNLYSFTERSTNSSGIYTTNSDGAILFAGLILSGNTLYGTAAGGGSSGNGTVFKVNTDGTDFTNLHSFTAYGTNSSDVYTNSDGANPHAGLILSGNTLYGTADGGGSSGYGTVFAVNTNGTGFTNLHTFAGDDGADPQAGLILAGNTLYGTTSAGGSSGNGTVFSLSFAPQLTLIPSGASVILSWPTKVAGFDYSGYTLQSTTNLTAPAVWSTNSPAPVVVNGQFTVTNPITGNQMFYRLSQ